MTGAATTKDAFLGGKLALEQPARGYRAGMDAVLLAAAVPEGEGEALDFGCGVGAIMLCARARLGPGWKWTGVEIDPPTALLARHNAAQFGDIPVVQGDALEWAKEWENRFDLVASNPPYFEKGEICPPGEGRDLAWQGGEGTVSWLSRMLFVCKPKGRVLFIHRAAELARLLGVIDRRAGEITILPLHPKPDEPASRVIVTARKGLKQGPARLLPGRALHEGEWLEGVTRNGDALRLLE